MDFIDTVVRTSFNGVQTTARELSGTLPITLLQKFVDPTNALVGRVNVGGNTTLGKLIDRINAPFGDTLGVWGVWNIGGLCGDDLLTSQHGEGRECQDSKSSNGHDLPLYLGSRCMNRN